MIATYRDPRYAASVRIEQLQERSPWRSDEASSDLQAIYARRAARSWAGGVAISGFVVMIIVAVLSLMMASPASPPRHLHPTYALAASVLASLLTYLLARPVAARVFRRRLQAMLVDGGDELSRLARLETNHARRAAAELAGVREASSLALPMIGISLLAPLSIHFVVWCALKGEHRLATDFDWWIGASLLLVGVAHIVLVGLAIRFARRVARSSFMALAAGSPVRGWSAYGWTVLGSIFPGIVAIAIPPILVAITGALFVPPMFSIMYRTALDERRALDVR